MMRRQSPEWALNRKAGLLSEAETIDAIAD